MRAIVTGGTLSYLSVVIGGGLAISYLLAASVFFTRVYRHAVRTGLIARYSAESVS
jgi:ABC-2 type transport system permease protein